MYWDVPNIRGAKGVDCGIVFGMYVQGDKTRSMKGREVEVCSV